MQRRAKRYVVACQARKAPHATASGAFFVEKFFFGMVVQWQWLWSMIIVVIVMKKGEKEEVEKNLIN